MLHEHPDGCGHCAWYADRNARLTVRMRHMAIQHHGLLKHKGEWRHCSEPACVEVWKLIEPRQQAPKG